MKLRSQYILKLAVFLLFISIETTHAQPVSLSKASSKNDTLRLFLIGNSFSQNATRYLPNFAKEGGHPLLIGRAELGGYSLQQHWELVEKAEKNPTDSAGRGYNGKSLRMLLSAQRWDMVTLQQASWLSADSNSYRPYAEKLYQYIKSICPKAVIVFHQTWAYREDADRFGQVSSSKQLAKTAGEMYERSREAYHSIAKQLNVKLIPVGDAFWKWSSEAGSSFQKDTSFNYKAPVYPSLPDEHNSIHAGYQWKRNKLELDTHHANNAGCYLGALIWYSFLFGESPLNVKFVPKELPAEFAARLRKTASGIEIAKDKTGDK